jgi:hypothetical protein
MFTRWSIRAFVWMVLAFLFQNGLAGSSAGFSPERASFSVGFRDEICPYRVMGVYVLPRETLTVAVMDSGKHACSLRTTAGEILKMGHCKWQWVSPAAVGLYPIVVADSSSLDSVTLNIWVMVPAGELKDEYLRGYRIGKYLSIPYKQLPIYKPPVGFIEVTRENEETLVSPHFKLRQFICKQAGDYPKYVVLRERLLLKLELILEKTNQSGYPCEGFEVLSGYRTPHHNRAIGNVKYSRHVYGDAADIFIDENPRDGIMDDLNRDGKIDYRDAGVLYDIIDGMYGKPWYRKFLGGLGRYKKTPKHGPFVHVDARGFRARWGD